MSTVTKQPIICLLPAAAAAVDADTRDIAQSPVDRVCDCAKSNKSQTVLTSNGSINEVMLQYRVNKT